MARFLHLSFTYAGGPPDHKAIEAALNYMAPDWLRYSSTCWIVWTSRPASDFLYAVKPFLGPDDSVLIVGLDMSDRNGWQPKWVWEWMDRKRQLGLPPPPAPPPDDLGALYRPDGKVDYSALAALFPPPPLKK